MAKLILSLDDQVIKDFEISKERMTIGRKPHNDIQIDNLAVSGEHAMIMTILNDSFLEDLASTNGTQVNGKAVKKHFLQPDDVVEIGKYKLRYINEKAGKVSQEEFEKTMVLRAPAGGAEATPSQASATNTQTDIHGTKATDTQAGGQTSTVSGADVPAAVQQQTTTVGTQSQPEGNVQEVAANAQQKVPNAQENSNAQEAQQKPAQAPPAAEVGGAIQILSGPNAGRELPLSKPLTTLGKPGIQVAVIARRPQGFFITHVEGANFPVVNGKSLDAQALKLEDHDIIELASVKMEFFLKG
jgi:pSer/pThr/pTyr-binding forkhead associated (FHA) protein